MIYLILPVHNRKDITTAFLQRLITTPNPAIQIVLVDDGSTDGTSKAVKALLPSSIILTGNGSLWWAGALQLGFDYLAGLPAKDHDIILICNDDSKLGANFLSYISEFHLANQGCLLLPHSIDEISGETLDKGVVVDWKRLSFKAPDPDHLANCGSTRGLSMTWRTLKTIGGMRPKLLPHYFSDYEFSIRAQKKSGIKLVASSPIQVLTNETTTGLHGNLQSQNPMEFLRKKFSNRCASNPIHASIFIILCCPNYFKFQNLARIWWATTREFLSTVKSVIKQKPY